MEYSRVTNQCVAMTDDQFKEILETMTAWLNLVKPEATFTITPGQANIEKLIDYSTYTGIKFSQEATQSLPIKFNTIGV